MQHNMTDCHNRIILAYRNYYKNMQEGQAIIIAQKFDVEGSVKPGKILIDPTYMLF